MILIWLSSCDCYLICNDQHTYFLLCSCFVIIISFSWNTNLNSIMNAVEDCYRKWAKKEGVDDSALSEWVKAIRHFV